MKPQHIVGGLLALAVVISLVQSHSALRRSREMDATAKELRASMDRLESRIKSLSSLPPSQGQLLGASSSPASADGPFANMHALEDRLHDLENTVSDLADAWNRFAADEGDKRRKAAMRAWGPEQATGAPDCNGAGDQQAAWAPAGMDEGEQWLETSYTNPVEIAQVRILENENPGAVVKIVAVLDGGTEVPLWIGDEPKLAAPADQFFAARTSVVAAKVRVYLDTSKVPGWNEIDAVELIGRDGSRQWAASAAASSTYAERVGQKFSDNSIPESFSWSRR